MDFVTHSELCSGCNTCRLVCALANFKEINPAKAALGIVGHFPGPGTYEIQFCDQCGACAEACPTGARVFGNILDPDSEIRYVLENKKVFRLKEDLGTEPKFWYYMD